MSMGMCSAACDRESVGLRTWRFACNLFTFFAGTLIVGVLVVLALSASACTWNSHVRCFSVSRDTLGVISSATEMWVMLAFAVALFAAMIAQMYRAPAWWSALIVVPASILGVSILPIGPGLPSLAREAMLDPPFFFAVVSVLFAGYQFSLFIGKLVGRLQR